MYVLPLSGNDQPISRHDNSLSEYVLKECQTDGLVGLRIQDCKPMSQETRIRDVTRRLIELPSISCSDPAIDMGNINVIEQLAEWLDDIGFSCEIMELPGKPDKANLIATLGSGPGGLVMAGHADTVPYDEGGWKSDPFTLTENGHYWHGLGTSDMKAFLGLAIEAARDFVHQPLQQPLIILATADEESGMDGARALVQAGRPKARYAVIGEPTGMHPVHIHKGIFADRIRVLGKSGHSSNPALGHNAIDGMHQVLNSIYAFRQSLAQRAQLPEFKVGHGTLNTGCIHGGDNANRIPAACELDIDLRFLPGQDENELRAELRQKISAALAGTEYRVEFEPLFEGLPAFSTPLDSPIIAACERLTGYRAQAVDFATEGALLNQLGMQTVIMGPGSIDCAHQPDEFLDTRMILPTIRSLQSLISEFCL